LIPFSKKRLNSASYSILFEIWEIFSTISKPELGKNNVIPITKNIIRDEPKLEKILTRALLNAWKWLWK